MFCCTKSQDEIVESKEKLVSTNYWGHNFSRNAEEKNKVVEQTPPQTWQFDGFFDTISWPKDLSWKSWQRVDKPQAPEFSNNIEERPFILDIEDDLTDTIHHPVNWKELELQVANFFHQSLTLLVKPEAHKLAFVES